MKREHLLHGCLFLCAYAGFVAYLGIGVRNVFAHAHAVRATAGNFAAPQNHMQQSVSPSQTSTVQIAASTEAVAVSESSSNPQADSAAADALSADVRVQITALAAKATTAEVPTQRRSAISKLGMLPLTPETIQALHTTLINDPVPVNRVQATSALRRLAQSNGDEDGRIQMLLNAALQDSEPAVVSAARATIDSLAAPET
jgi:hypothetical protein